ncbi:M20 family metallopeptidase [Phytoactinopolyspora limicola]|uniref:M20 family metallopeptidase n=1 Tax=Phytoactinopolyspora limicola TaxID=2715536 RepID=UPI0014094825|nr:M20/M25/M40 family metallo-hydrolase [Phytoactinopolyspora limicola]
MDVLELTHTLVAIDSQNPGVGEREIVAHLGDLCATFGLPARVVEPVSGRPNLIVTVDRGPGRHLALSGHVDTKPVGDTREQWRTDPFELTVVDGDAYGLGSSDMKGAVAAMLLALRRFAESGPSGSLSLVLTADEEQGSAAGAQALTTGTSLPEIDAMVICEPSGISEPWEAIHLVSRGICCFEIDIWTTQGHSGLSPALGRNAILVAADVLHAFESFQPTVSEPGRVPCEVTVNPGMLIEGGVAFGTWPGLCTVGVELRLAPGMDRDTVRAEIEGLVKQTVGGAARVDVRYRPGSLGWMPAVELDPGHEIVAASQRAAGRVLGRELPVRGYPGGTDASYFMRDAGIPTVTSLGPGWLSVAHGPNERVGVDQLSQAVDLYEVLADEYLRGRVP